MGRKAGSTYINPKKFGAFLVHCMKDMITFLSCLALNSNCDEKCVRQKGPFGYLHGVSEPEKQVDGKH